MRVIFRADASSAVGGGHIMRCLALAEELSGRGADITFAVGKESPETVPPLSRSAHEIVVLQASQSEELSEIKERTGNCDLIVIDHYERDGTFEREARSIAKTVLVVDDLPERPHDCDVLLDQTFGRKAGDYERLVPEGALVLTGTSYALLRPAFRSLRHRALQERRTRHAAKMVRRILVSLGAVDGEGLTRQALDAINRSKLDVSVDVVIGSADPKALGLIDQARQMSQPVVFHGFDANVAELMLAADLAIGAAGSSAWERCCMGLPTMMVVLADNQNDIGTGLQSKGAANLTPVSDFSSPERFSDHLAELASNTPLLESMSAAAARICDGQGAGRVADLVYDLTEQTI